jgi:hypothetical protein
MLSHFGLLGIEPDRQLVTANWISAIFRKLDRLLARHLAGKLRRLTLPGVTLVAVTPGGKLARKPAVCMPRKFGWLVLTGKHHAACYGLQLRQLLETPEMAELLGASVQAKRILRPLCCALAIELPWTVAPARAEPKPRVRKLRTPPEPYRIALPRGVMAWARREKALEKAIRLVR